MKLPSNTGLSLLLELIKLSDTNFAILFEKMSFKPLKKVINGRLKYGYGIKKDNSFYFTLPDNYFIEYQRYSFNFWRNFIIVIILFLIYLFLNF